MMKDIFDPWGPYVPIWNTIFAVLSVVAVSIDPLFLYILVLDETKKCLSTDHQLKIIALASRSVTDVACILQTLFQIRATYLAEASGVSKKGGLVLSTSYWETARRIRRSYILIDILAILPLPQVLVSIYFSNMGDFRSLTTSKFVNFLLYIQYVPRVLRIYLACEKVKRTPGAHSRIVFFNGVLNVSLYIVASHVFGALWYFFAIQQETACWHHACEKQIGCIPDSFDCRSNTSANLTFLSSFCSINSPDATTFDYGIYADAIHSGILTRTTSFLQKFVRCFWWGLRNHSPFAWL
ncbi:hypothetical protein TIFTF001_013634 [Ficus carica]|uniref:Ion transport domain-containing protein n=1 Tax=Ficus carica TaxID=3494 RepID=A0AA88A1A2_FICCA|nr:hypothetical protein TIFTF001_013634 [Ficus carica]